MPDLKQIYTLVPYPLKVAAASYRGYQLRNWRYTDETDQLVSAAIDREMWTPEQWEAWRGERLARVLHRAATRVPYYQRQWAARRRNGDRASWEILENWPILMKEPLRQDPQAFVADDIRREQMYEDSTSGTTGKPITLWFSRRAVQEWYALFEARARVWNGVSRRDRWVTLGGALVTPYSRTRPPFWVWNAGLNQLYMSSYHLADEFAPHYFKAMRDHKVVYMLAYATSMYALAQSAKTLDLPAPQMRVAISNAEPLYDYRRRLIEKVFQCRVVDTYGMTEVVTAAGECAAGRMHIWPEAGVTEILDDEQDVPVGPGTSGRLICTGLVNEDMPLIRYQVGDRGSLPPVFSPCSCGRTLPYFQTLEGRMDDVIITPDRRRVGAADTILKVGLPIFEAQIVQESLEAIKVRLVPTEGYSEEHSQYLRKALRERLGEMRVDVELVDAIPRMANGKFKVVLSRLASTNPPPS